MEQKEARQTFELEVYEFKFREVTAAYRILIKSLIASVEKLVRAHDIVENRKNNLNVHNIKSDLYNLMEPINRFYFIMGECFEMPMVCVAGSRSGKDCCVIDFSNINNPDVTPIDPGLNTLQMGSHLVAMDGHLAAMGKLSCSVISVFDVSLPIKFPLKSFTIDIRKIVSDFTTMGAIALHNNILAVGETSRGGTKGDRLVILQVLETKSGISLGSSKVFEVPSSMKWYNFSNLAFLDSINIVGTGLNHQLLTETHFNTKKTDALNPGLGNEGLLCDAGDPGSLIVVGMRLYEANTGKLCVKLYKSYKGQGIKFEHLYNEVNIFPKTDAIAIDSISLCPDERAIVGFYPSSNTSNYVTAAYVLFNDYTDVIIINAGKMPHGSIVASDEYNAVIGERKGKKIVFVNLSNISKPIINPLVTLYSNFELSDLGLIYLMP